jgi:putative membrane protein
MEETDMLLRIIIVWLALVLGLWTASRVMPGVRFSSPLALWGGAIVLGLVDAIVGPIVLIATFPFTVITLGLWVFVMNGLLVMLAARLVSGFDVDGLFPAVNTGLILAAFGLAGYVLAEWFLFGSVSFDLVAESTRRF